MRRQILADAVVSWSEVDLDALGRLLDRLNRDKKALDKLAAHGLVNQISAGGSILNTLNREHILAPFFIEIVNLRNELIDRIGAIVSEDARGPDMRSCSAHWQERRDEQSDIDIALVWDDEAEDTENIAARVSELTGNDCNLLPTPWASSKRSLTERQSCMRRSPLRESIY